jgi:hypothetical protein
VKDIIDTMIQKGENLDNILDLILELAGQIVGTRTFFISRTDDDTFALLKVKNNNGCFLEEGSFFPLEHSV